MLTKERRWKSFRDLNRSDVDVELHLHTNWTDGEASIKDVLERSAVVGLRQIAFTEHVRYDTTWYPDFTATVRQAAIMWPAVDVLLGCEAKALDNAGKFDASPAILEQCDLVLGSVHRFPDGQGGFLDFASLQQDQFAQIEFDLACGLLEAAPIHVLAHPGGMYSRRFGVDLPESLMRELMERSSARGIAIEINSAYLKDVDTYLRLCAEVNPLVSIGSDMHRLSNLGHCRDTLLMKRAYTE